jgi:hypothetical protein
VTSERENQKTHGHYEDLERRFVSQIVGVFRRRPELRYLAFGAVGVLLIPMLLGGLDYFWPPLSVRVAYLMMLVVSIIRRADDLRFCVVSCALVTGVGLFFYARAYFHWSSLGLILDYEMPIAVLAIAVPSSTILVGRRIRTGSTRPNV